LYYRLNVVPVRVPPLRDRREDVPLLIQHFISIYAQKNGKSITGCSPEALELLTDYSWPGNVRELENAIERVIVLTRSEQIEPTDLPREIQEGGSGGGAAGLSFPIGTPLADIEMRVIRETLRHTRGDKRAAAKLLGIATRTIYRRLESPDSGKKGDQ
ncbi:MAG: sigma-54-dependent Fis family transcriptional regulator, partial [Deltaproteobacteria bacterium]|nr:sigma-54-dependent Fis family transcriptional regulator [Deltaproteobacteria bacterium]